MFSLFNGAATHARAVAFAERILADVDITQSAARGRGEGNGGSRGAEAARVIDRAFRLAFGRPPTPDETRTCAEHWARLTQRHRGLKRERPALPTEVVRQAVEENTGEKFTFREPLTLHHDFVPDRPAAVLDPDVLGLADLCLVLLNANEFVYVY